jgi:hypothetical protein
MSCEMESYSLCHQGQFFPFTFSCKLSKHRPYCRVSPSSNFEPVTLKRIPIECFFYRCVLLLLWFVIMFMQGRPISNYIPETIFLGHIVLQLFCSYN